MFNRMYIFPDGYVIRGHDLAGRSYQYKFVSFDDVVWC